MCLSEHEGFCVPLVEAMHFGLPIVAFASTGVPGTLHCGGLLMEQKDPIVTAELIARILGDKTLRQSMGQAARARLEAFRPARVAGLLKKALREKMGLDTGHDA